MYKTATVVLASAVAQNGTFTVGYPDNTSAGDFAAFGHYLMAKGLGGAKFSQDAGTMSVSFGATEATVTYKGATSIPAGSMVTCQFNMAGQDDGKVLDVGHVPGLTPALTYIINLGTPDTSDPNGICESQSATGAHDLDLDGAYADPYGGAKAVADVPRNVIVDSGGADTAVLTIYGKDVYGVEMAESITLNGTSVVAGKKAFKEVNRVAASATISNGAFVGWGDVLGLPVFVGDADQIIAEAEDAAWTYAFKYDGDATGDPVNVTAGITGTFVAGVQTAATATTGDVRGTYDPATAADGEKAFKLLVWLTDPNYKGVNQYAG